MQTPLFLLGLIGSPPATLEGFNVSILWDCVNPRHQLDHDDTDSVTQHMLSTTNITRSLNQTMRGYRGQTMAFYVCDHGEEHIYTDAEYVAAIQLMDDKCGKYTAAWVWTSTLKLVYGRQHLNNTVCGSIIL
ncbi:hypothetical protein F5B20DRAFT_581527 [Whalleya microplaca]|nr:hypothetical protein F5B20DRAFT_581527 [Whalleya microplaca]